VAAVAAPAEEQQELAVLVAAVLAQQMTRLAAQEP
jgi:hypothetical protein